MEPNPYGRSSAPEPPTWEVQPPAPAVAPGHTRVGLVVLATVLMEILLIGFGANQWVSDKIGRDNPSDFRSRAIENSWLTFTWRFTPRSGLTRLWVSELVLIGVVLALSTALVWVLVRGRASWGRAFFGTWLAVLGSTLVGAFGRGLVDPFGQASLPGTDRVTRALFGPLGPTSTAFVGGVGLGFVVALLASVVAVASRRSQTPPAAGMGATAAEMGPPTFPEYAAPMAAAPAGPPPWQERQWAPEPAQPTTQLPRTEPGGGEPAPPVAPLAAAEPQAGPRPAESAPPAGFPRPPDDEELGHIEH